MEQATIVYLTGRCANGAHRDGGSRTHVVLGERYTWGRALCGAKPGRLSSGFVESDGAEVPSCPRCRARAERIAEGEARIASALPGDALGAAALNRCLGTTDPAAEMLRDPSVIVLEGEIAPSDIATARKIARLFFASRGDHTEAHVSETKLAALLAVAAARGRCGL